MRQRARWSGVDLTTESVERVKTRLTLRELPYEDLRRGSVLDLPFADGTFDMVFSHGVLHHVLEIKRAWSGDPQGPPVPTGNWSSPSSGRPLVAGIPGFHRLDPPCSPYWGLSRSRRLES